MRLISLASSKNPKRRMVAAAHPQTPLVTLFLLANDSDPRVRREVARNAAAPRAVLAQIMKYGDDEVTRNYVQWRLDNE